MPTATVGLARSRCSINSSNEERGRGGYKTQPFLFLTTKSLGQEPSVQTAHQTKVGTFLRTPAPRTHTPEILT